MMSIQKTKRTHIAIIGAGAAGLFAAGTALLEGALVTIYEHNERPGRKVRITGKGRCNVTNQCDNEAFLSNVLHNKRFLYASLCALSTADTMALFEELGVPLKVERGNRVFPVSDQAEDIVNALMRYASKAEFCYEHVEGLLIEEGKVVGVKSLENRYYDSVILATGGISYTSTGSDGSGFALAESAGHTILPLRGSLVPLTSHDKLCRDAMGLSLRNVRLSIEDQKGKVLFEDFGEMLFTHFGLSGPLAISASAHIIDCDITTLTAHIDLKPALDEQTLSARLVSDFAQYSNRDFRNAFSDLLPMKLITPFVRRTGISLEKKVHSITKEERAIVVKTLKKLTVPLSGTRPIDEAIVTAGGVLVKEISPKTMMSKCCQNLYFAGEMIDVDAYTGGYNLQIAFSTGFLAGKSAAMAETDEV